MCVCWEGKIWIKFKQLFLSFPLFVDFEKKRKINNKNHFTQKSKWYREDSYKIDRVSLLPSNNKLIQCYVTALVINTQGLHISPNFEKIQMKIQYKNDKEIKEKNVSESHSC